MEWEFLTSRDKTHQTRFLHTWSPKSCLPTPAGGSSPLQSTPERFSDSQWKWGCRYSRSIPFRGPYCPLLILPSPNYISEEEDWAVQRGFQPTPSGWLQREEILYLSQNIQWKVIKSIHDTTHLGRDSFTSLISRSFNGKGLSKTIEQITSCLTSFNNPQGAQKPH